jgi:hypothetical protein
MSGPVAVLTDRVYTAHLMGCFVTRVCARTVGGSCQCVWPSSRRKDSCFSTSSFPCRSWVLSFPVWFNPHGHDWQQVRKFLSLTLPRLTASGESNNSTFCSWTAESTSGAKASHSRFHYPIFFFRSTCYCSGMLALLYLVDLGYILIFIAEALPQQNFA